MWPIERQQIAIPAVNQKIVQGQLVDDNTIQFLHGGVDELLAEVRLVTLAT